MHPLFICSIYPCNCLLEPDSRIICSCVICTMSTYAYTSSSTCSLKYKLNYAEFLSLNLQQFLELFLLCRRNAQPSSLFTPFSTQTSWYNIRNSLPPSFPTCWAKNTGKVMLTTSFPLSTFLSSDSRLTAHIYQAAPFIWHPALSPVPKPPTESSSAARDYYLRANFSSCEPRKPSLWSYGWSVSPCAAQKNELNWNCLC